MFCREFNPMITIRKALEQKASISVRDPHAWRIVQVGTGDLNRHSGHRRTLNICDPPGDEKFLKT